MTPPVQPEPATTPPTDHSTSGTSPVIAAAGVSNATRHLCAAAYLDDDFRRAGLNAIYHQPFRFIAPSYGFDLITTLGHCLRAAKLATIRDLTIVGALFVFLCLSPAGVVAAVSVLVLIVALKTAWELVRTSSIEFVENRLTLLDIQVRTGMVIAKLTVAGALVAASVPLILFLIGANTAMALQPDVDPVTALGTVLMLVVVTVSAVLAIPVAASLWRHRQLQQMAPGRSPAPPPRSEKFDDIWRRSRNGNAVIYSGYRPFVGAGWLNRTWGFAMRMVPAGDPLAEIGRTDQREFESAPFSAEHLVDHLRHELGQLSGGDTPEGQLPGLTVSDCVYLASTECAERKLALTNEEVAEVIRRPVAPARHYLVCQVISWRGELVSTVYVHVAVQGRSMYLEFTSCYLPPCNDSYRTVDELGFTDRVGYVKAALAGLLDAPGTIGRAPINLVRSAASWILRSGSARPRHDSDRQGVNYGAEIGLRELGMADDTRDHLQTQEILKYSRIVERRLFAAVLDFLDARGVSTAEFRQRAATVMNNGTIISGSATVAGGVNNQTYASVRGEQ